MRKILLTATMLSLVGGLAFASGSPQGWVGAGDANLAVTGASSNAGVASTQGTGANASVKGNGAVLVGTVSGNYTNVQTGASANAGPGGSQTGTYAQQVNVGGTVSGGVGMGGQPSNDRHGYGQQSGASGSTGGGQNSQGAGSSSATAGNANLGGFVAVQPIGGQGHRPR